MPHSHQCALTQSTGVDLISFFFKKQIDSGTNGTYCECPILISATRCFSGTPIFSRPVAASCSLYKAANRANDGGARQERFMMLAMKPV
jgi:hypothetical protein